MLDHRGAGEAARGLGHELARQDIGHGRRLEVSVVSADYAMKRPHTATARLIDPLLQAGRAPAKAAPVLDPESPRRLPREPAPSPRSDAPRPKRDLDAEVRLILDGKLFDADWYRRGTGQPEADAALQVLHYLQDAKPNRWSPNPLFDPAFYARTYGHELGDIDPLAHYLREGWRRGFDPHPLFSVSFYLERNDDVRTAAVEPLFHYIAFGWREGRRPCPEFDVAYYLDTYEDVRSRDNEPLRHYLEYGAVEGRDPSATFETRWYAQHVLKGDAANALAHFRLSGSDPDALTRSIGLDARHAMSDADFARWTRTFRPRREPGPLAHEIIRVAATGDGRGDTSLAAARALSRAASTLPSRHVYLVCDASDEIDDGLLAHLSRRMERAELVVFDFAFRREDAWTPVLLAGANAAQIEAVDATLSRFAIASRLLARLDIHAGAAPWEVLKAAITKLRAEARLDLFAHLPVPLLRANDVSDALRARRRALARDAQLGSGRASGRGPAVKEPADPSVSIVICTKDRCRLLAQLLERLIAFPAALVRDIVIVTNADADGFAAEVHAHYAAQSRVTLVQHEGPYNFSQQSNRGAARCSGDLLLFLNDDIVPIVPHWLDALRAPFARPEVGIAGPLLLYPDETIQHAGMYLGFNGVAGHTLRGLRLPEGDYMLDASAPRNVSVLTGAALLTRRSLFEALNGFDRQLGTYLQDVDYCLRARNGDHEIVYEPRSLLFHMESVSMREKAGEPVFNERRTLEHAHFGRKWKDALSADPFHNPNFDVQDESLRTLARCPLAAL